MHQFSIRAKMLFLSTSVTALLILSVSVSLCHGVCTCSPSPSATPMSLVTFRSTVAGSFWNMLFLLKTGNITLENFNYAVRYDRETADGFLVEVYSREEGDTSDDNCTLITYPVLKNHSESAIFHGEMNGIGFTISYYSDNPTNYLIEVIRSDNDGQPPLRAQEYMVGIYSVSEPPNGFMWRAIQDQLLREFRLSLDDQFEFKRKLLPCPIQKV